MDKLETHNAQAIKPIDKNTVHKICSGQVVLSLATAVKELVENSLDAGATNIEVRLKNYGLDLIEISDNGCGVVQENFAALSLKYHTSKLEEFSDLLDVKSFGFRGEALSSLCALANLVVTTKHATSQFATKIEYDQKGHIKNKVQCSRTNGTTVSLSNLFFTLPVRQKEFNRNHKKEFMKMTQLLYAYCLISKGVKITCTNQTKSGQKTVVVATQGSNSYRDNLACVFGTKQLQTLLEIVPHYKSNIQKNVLKSLSGELDETLTENIDIEDNEIDLSENSNEATECSQTNSQLSIKSQGYTNNESNVEFTGYISSCAHGCGRSSTDRQFFYVNSRPCEPTKIVKLVNSIYKQYNPNQYPFIFLNINLARDGVDVNVTPDKRKLFLTKEKKVLDVVESSLLKLFENIPSTIKVEKPETSIEIEKPRLLQTFLKSFASRTMQNKSDEVTKPHELKRKSTSILDFVSKKSIIFDKYDVEKENQEKRYKYDPVGNKTDETDASLESEEVKSIPTHLKNKTEIGEIDAKDCLQDECLQINTVPDSIPVVKSEDLNSKNITIKNTEIIPEPMHDIQNKEIMFLDFTDQMPNTQICKLEDVISEQHTTVCRIKRNTEVIAYSPAPKKMINKSPIKKVVITDKEDLGPKERPSTTLNTSIEHVKALMQSSKDQRQNISNIDRMKFRTEINPVLNKKCEEELSKALSKESFNRMEVLGQFNLGFIVTRLDDDLFIIDQHATDEIYNFETLQKTTELTCQQLVVPQQLELTGVNEQILIENLETFKRNGFTFEIDADAPPTKRVKLLTIPMSKSWVFGKDDIEEMLFMMREDGYDYCRPSRVRAMFASRACRKSVMIGTALSKADMRQLVDHMAEIDKPWNCPHGRPTIRHLVNLAMVERKKSKP